MKRNDLILIGLIAISSAILTYVAASTVLSSYTQQATKVPFVEKITSDVAEPDPTVFNVDAINPAVQINIDGTKTD